MKSIDWTNRTLVARLMLAMVLGVGLAAASSSARAQDRENSIRWDRLRVGKYAFTMGYNRGYEDAAQASRRNYRDEQLWRDGAEGWQDPMGNRTIFRENFRRGFAQGFMDARVGRARRYSQGDLDRITSGFNGSGRYDHDSMARIADQNGYRDGFRRGSYDASHRRRTDPDNIILFRTGTNGYRPQYGDRDPYRQAYRDGFRRGYEEAFHGHGR